MHKTQNKLNFFNTPPHTSERSKELKSLKKKSPNAIWNSRRLTIMHPSHTHTSHTQVEQVDGQGKRNGKKIEVKPHGDRRIREISRRTWTESRKPGGPSGFPKLPDGQSVTIPGWTEKSPAVFPL